MNKKILYKFLLIFTVLAFSLLITNTKCFATDYPSDVYNSSYIENNGATLQTIYDIIDNNPDIFKFTSSELPEYQLISKIKTNVEGVYHYSFYSISVPVYNDTTAPTYNNKSFAFRYKFTSSPYTYKYFKILIKDTGLWVSPSTITENTASSSTLIENLGFSNSYEIVNSNFDILNEKGNVVFQQPPQVQEQATTLAPIVEGMETEKTLAEIVGILPVVLVVIVGLLATRKAIKFLMKILKQG